MSQIVGLPQLGVMVNGHKFMAAMTGVTLAEKRNGQRTASLSFGSRIINADASLKLTLSGRINGGFTHDASGQRGVKTTEYLSGARTFGTVEPFVNFPNGKRYYWTRLSEGEKNGLLQARARVKAFTGGVTGLGYDMDSAVVLTVSRIAARESSVDYALLSELVSASADDTRRESALAELVAELAKEAATVGEEKPVTFSHPQDKDALEALEASLAA